MLENDLLASRELKRRLEAAVDLIDFRVFGSRARGTAAADSDLDIFVEVDHIDLSIRRLIQDIAWEVGLDYSLVIAPVIFTRKEVSASPLRSSAILAAVMEEGVAV